MEAPTARQVNDFQFQQSEDESISQTSNMSGTFNNDSLKINQRKKKKLKSDVQSLASDNESLRSFTSQGQQQKHVQQKQQQSKQNLPPPPMLIQKMSTMLQSKLPPPPVLMQILSEKQKSVHIVEPSFNNGSNGNSKTVKGNSSPILKKPDDKGNQVIKEEESQDGASAKSNSRIETGKHDNQDEHPQVEDPFIIKINLKENSLLDKQPPPKIPNTNYALLSQAKYELYQAYIKSDQSFHMNEITLSQIVTSLSAELIKQKEDELYKMMSEQNKQNLLLQQQIAQQLSKQKSKSSDGQQLELQQKSQSNNEATIDEFKKLREENQELRMKSQFLEQDLEFQALKTKDLQTKYESEIENLRSQLKGSQSEQFVRQQIEHKKLIEDNSVLMREVKILQDQLRDEQSKVFELFEDAQAVRYEIMKEMGDYEKTKAELEKIRVMNKHLRKRLDENSIDFSEAEDQSMEDEEDVTGVDDTLGAGDVSIKQKKKKVMVSVGVSRADSIISLPENFNQKLEELIDEKSRSIVNVITQNQISHFYNAYTHPYAVNMGPQVFQGQQNSQNQLLQQQQNIINPRQMQQEGYYNQRHKIVELSINESEGQLRFSNNDSSQVIESPAQIKSEQRSIEKSIEKSNSSELQILKHKIREMRDRHQTQLQDQMSKQPSQQSMHQKSQLSGGNNQHATHSQVQIGANSFFNNGTAEFSQLKQSHGNFANLNSQSDQQDDIMNQFKTPVFNQDQQFKHMKTTNEKGKGTHIKGQQSKEEEFEEYEEEFKEEYQQRNTNRKKPVYSP